MAERHQLKIADRNDIADDDPFAELTRIMGFDPRESVAQQASAQPPAQDDFDIDLEKELMGEFADFDEPAPLTLTASGAEADLPSPEPRQPARQEGEDHAVAFDADMDDADMDSAVAASLEDLDPVEDVTEAAETWQAQPEDHAELPDEAAGEDGPDDASLSAQDTWFGPAEDEAIADESETVGSEQAFGAFDDEAFDTAVSADLDGAFPVTEEADAVAADFAYEEAGPADEAPAAEEQPVDEVVSYAGTLEEERLEAADAYRDDDRAADPDDFDSYFDSAMADVDMDFTARPEEQPSVSAMPEVDEAAVDAQGMDDAEFDPDEAFEASVFAGPAVPVELSPEPSYAEPAAPAATGDTLEDELNALLAKMSARPAVTADAAWPMATPTASPQPAAPPAAAEAVFGDDDLDAALVADLHAMDLSDAHEPVESVSDDASAGMSDWSVAGSDAEAPAVSRTEGAQQQGAPEIETVEVPERVVALADDLDIPDVPFEEAGSDKLDGDLENEFAELLGQMNASPAQLHAAYDDDAYAGGFRDDSGQAAAAFVQSPASPYDSADTDADALLAEAAPFSAAELAYDPEDTPTLDPAGAEERDRPRRGLLIAGIIGAVAIAGGLGALAMSFGGSGTDEAPALVKADNSPIKVKPENPGGTVIPNQDNKVYEAVAKGIKPVAPEQQKLVTSNEEPVDVDAVKPRVVGLDKAQPAAPAGKSEDRIVQTAQAEGVAASQPPLVTPRKVRTMVVKPDGTLVPREEEAPQVAAAEPADPAPQHVVADDRTGAVPTVEDDNVAAAGEEAQEPAGANAEAAATPRTAPIAPQRPSDQPVDVVGEVKPDRVASAAPTNAAVPAGAWSMQIASQPTAESAQSTYQTLSRRYASVLGGHEVSIVKADIAGKGTFYRVRVPTGSRNDAIELCESYKAAGGNCFVSK